MNSFDEKDVISPLKCIPGDVPATTSRFWALGVQFPGQVRNSRHSLYLAHELPRSEAECGIRQQRVHDPGHSALDSHGSIEAKPGSIQELRTEDVLFTERDELAPRYNVCQQLVKCIRLDDFRVVA